MNARLYGRYASDPGRDVDILTIRASAKDADKMNLKMFFNMDSPDIMISGLQERLPAIASCLSSFAEKHQLFRYAALLKMIVIDCIEGAHNIVNNLSPHLSEVSILFRNTVVQYQKNVQVFLDAAIKVLRETRVKLPGSEEMTSLIEVVNKMLISINSMVQEAIHMVGNNVEYALNVVSGGATKHLEKLFETLKLFLGKAQDFVYNTLKSDVFEAINGTINYILDIVRSLVNQFNYTVTDYVQQAPANYRSYVKVKGRRLEINL